MGLLRLSKLTTRGIQGAGPTSSNVSVRKRRGFTLLELMIVVAIVIIVAASAAITIGQNGRNKLQASALQVQALVDRARQTALAQRSPTCIVISLIDGTFSFYAAPVQATTDPTQVSGQIVQKVVLQGGVGFPVQRGVTIAGEPLSVYFNKGTAKGMGYLEANDYSYLDATRKIRLWFDGFGHPDVEALPNTGLATLGWPSGWLAGPLLPSQRAFGFITLTVGNGSLAVQVVVNANSGTSEVRWIGK